MLGIFPLHRPEIHKPKIDALSPPMNLSVPEMAIDHIRTRPIANHPGITSIGIYRNYISTIGINVKVGLYISNIEIYPNLTLDQLPLGIARHSGIKKKNRYSKPCRYNIPF